MRVVTLFVKDVRLPTTPAAIAVVPLMTLAAKFDPGMLGSEILPPVEGVDVVEVDAAGIGLETVPPILRR